MMDALHAGGGGGKPRDDVHKRRCKNHSRANGIVNNGPILRRKSNISGHQKIGLGQVGFMLTKITMDSSRRAYTNK